MSGRREPMCGLARPNIANNALPRKQSSKPMPRIRHGLPETNPGVAGKPHFTSITRLFCRQLTKLLEKRRTIVT